jgi:hypothetical protein
MVVDVRKHTFGKVLFSPLVSPSSRPVADFCVCLQLSAQPKDRAFVIECASEREWGGL